MMKILRTSPGNVHFNELVNFLDAELAISDGEGHAFYDQFNKLDHIKYCILLYENEKPIGCGAIKQYQPEIMEIKRMFVLKGKRGHGNASIILKEIELCARELGALSCILETGVNQPEAIALYKKNGYHLIPNYGQYVGIEKSFCFRKNL